MRLPTREATRTVGKSCDDCRFYSWYWDRCIKWGCEVDGRSVCNHFEKYPYGVLNRCYEGAKEGGNIDKGVSRDGQE